MKIKTELEWKESGRRVIAYQIPMKLTVDDVVTFLYTINQTEPIPPSK